MANAVVNNNAPVAAPQPFVNDPINALRSIQENMLAIASSLGPTETHDSHVRMYHAWHSMAGCLADANGLQIPPAPSQEEEQGIDDIDNDNEETDVSFVLGDNEEDAT